MSIPALDCFTGASTGMAGGDYINMMKRNQGSLNHGKILVVDDEKFNCDIIYAFMKLLGFSKRAEMTTFANDG